MTDLRKLSSRYDIPDGYNYLGSPTYVGMKSQSGPAFYDTPFNLGYAPLNVPGNYKQNDPHVTSLDKGYNSSVIQRMANFNVGSSILSPPRLDNYTFRNSTGWNNSGPAGSQNPSTSTYFSTAKNTYSGLTGDKSGQPGGGIGPNDGRY